MKIKPITQKTYADLMKLADKKLDSKLDWLNHVGCAYAIENVGRLQYIFNVKIGRNISELITVQYTVPLDGEYRKMLEVVKS